MAPSTCWSARTRCSRHRSTFTDLGLAIIDEQHRFGVHQRLALGEKGPAADVLVMTATPIPRTLVLTYFGDMDVSQITGKPAGRKPVKTTAMPLDKLDDLIERVGGRTRPRQEALLDMPAGRGQPPNCRSDLRRGTICRSFASASATRSGSSTAACRGGEGSGDDAFRDGATRLLVATTVVEVGVDVH